MKKYFFYLVLIVLAIFIYVTEEVSFDLFTIWNMLPLIISLILYKYGQKQEIKIYGAYGFLIGGMILSGYFHMAWFFNWDGIKTGSSTSGLIFIFIPIYSLIPGGIGYFVGRSFAKNK